MAEDDYARLMGFKPSLRQQMRHDTAVAPPSAVLPGHPSYDLKGHLAYVQELWTRYPLNTDEKCEAHLLDLHKRIWKGARIPWMIWSAINRTIKALLVDNNIFRTFPITIEDRDYLTRMQARLSTNAYIEAADRAFIDFFRNLNTLLPAAAFEEARDISSEICLPLSALLPDIGRFPNGVYHAFALPEVAGQQVFPDTARRLLHNVLRASGHDPATYDGKKKLVYAHEHPDPLTYLQDTPFLEITDDPVPFTIPRKAYGEHGVIFAPTGHGKTQTLQHIVLQFLKEPDPPAMFIIDSMGTMLKLIERLALFDGRLKDRLVIIDPTDATPPALNFFKLNAPNSIYFYLFKAIDQSLTARQATMISYLIALMREIDGSTLDTLREVCEDKTPKYQAEIDLLDPVARDFFNKQFYGKDALVNMTKAQITARLYSLARFPAFMQMFNARDNRFDAYKCMQEKKIVLVNTDAHNLDEASPVLGRFIIAQCLAAARSRANIPFAERHLALLIVDECKQYVDEQTERILSDARQFGLGLLMATQAPHQLPEGVQRELATNTTIKMMGPVDYAVASRLARDMRTTPEFIMAMKTNAPPNPPPHYAEFACHIRNFTDAAIKLTIPFFQMEAEPRMDDAAYRAMRDANRKIMSDSIAAKPTATSSPIAPTSDDDVHIKPKPWD